MHKKIGHVEFYTVEELPKKYAEELKNILDNVKAIHGPVLVEFIKFQISLLSLLGVTIQGTGACLFTDLMKHDMVSEQFKDGDHVRAFLAEAVSEDLVKVIAAMTGNILDMHAASLFLTPAQIEVAKNTITAFKSVTDALERERNEPKSKPEGRKD